MAVGLLAGCVNPLEERNDAPIRRLAFKNVRSQPVAVVYEVPSSELVEGYEPEPLRLAPGESGSIAPIPHEDRCLAAPIVATDRAGEVVLTVSQGYCWGRPANDSGTFFLID